MAITYSPSIWKGRHFEDFFSESLYANSTVDKGLVRFIPNIKSEIQLGTIGGAPVVQNYVLTPNAPQGSFNIADRTMKPAKKLVHDRFDPNAMLSTLFSEDMAAGAGNMTSARQMKIMEQYLVPRIGKAVESAFWAGIVDELVASTTKVARAGAALSVASILDEIKGVYAALPGEVLTTGRQIIYLPQEAKQLVLIANADRTYRDLLSVNGDTISYLDCPLAFVPLKRPNGDYANAIIAGDKMDFVWGTDLLSDDSSMEVNKVTNESDEMFYKVVFTLGTAALVHTQKVLSTI